MSLRVAILSVAVVVASVCPVPAADFEKYLPTDTSGIVTIDVTQVVAAKPFDKHLRKPAEGLLGNEAVAPLLKLAGIDPLKDVTRVTVAFAPSLFRTEAQPGSGVSSGSGLFVVVNGRFDAKKIHSLVEQLAADGVGVEGHKVGDKLVYEFGLPLVRVHEHGFAVVLDANTLVISSHRDFAEESLKVAARKDAAASKEVRSLVGTLDGKQTIAWAFSSQMVSSQAVSSNQNGGRPPVVKVTTRTYADNGIESVSGGLNVGEKLLLTTQIVFQKPESLKEFVQAAEQIREIACMMLGQLAVKEKELVPAVEAIKGVKLTPKDKTLTISGQVDSDVIGVALKMLTK